MNKMQVLVSSFLAGILVGIAGVAELLLRDAHPVAAAMLFGVMLLAVLSFDLHLLTAKAGYLLWDSRLIGLRAGHLALSLVGNFAGAFAMGYLLNYVYPKHTFSAAYVEEKFAAAPLAVIVSAVLCGMLMFVAAHAYLRTHGKLPGVVITLGAGAAIALCGFEHSVTDVFRLAFTRAYTGRAVAVVLLAVVCNFVGALIMSLLYSYKKNTDKGHTHASEEDE